MRRLHFGREFFAIFVVLWLFAFLYLAESRHDLSRYVPAPDMLRDLPVLWRLIVAVFASAFLSAVGTLIFRLLDPDWETRPIEWTEPSRWSLVYGWTQAAVALVALLFAIATLNPLLMLVILLYGGNAAWWINDYYKSLSEYEDWIARREPSALDGTP
jgi:hypothetical protein